MKIDWADAIYKGAIYCVSEPKSEKVGFDWDAFRMRFAFVVVFWCGVAVGALLLKH